MPKDKGKKLPDLGLAYWPLKSTTNYVMKNPPPLQQYPNGISELVQID